jgi:G:T-mismatch repair DNA endonuclease (very short patch repair protein)
MSIILKYIGENFNFLFFELPDFIEYKGKTCNKFSMTSPAGLIRALNANNEKLSDLLDGKENYKAFWESAKIARKKIVVRKFVSNEERKEFVENLKVKRKLITSFRQCAICDKICKKSKRFIGTCGADTCYNEKLKARNLSVSEGHWCKSDILNIIRDKKIKTRIENDKKLNRKYTAWNKGKTGIYSEETLEKIRAATRLQFHRELFKKTAIEKKIEDFLKLSGIKHKYSFILCKRQFDFLVNDKIIIEAHGDFWHGNPKIYGEGLKQLRDHQMMKRLDDKAKMRIAKEQSFEYIEFWEYDIHNNWDIVSKKILELVNGNY